MQLQPVDTQAVQTYLQLLQGLNTPTRNAILRGLLQEIMPANDEKIGLLLSLYGSWSGDEKAQDVIAIIEESRSLPKNPISWE